MEQKEDFPDTFPWLYARYIKSDPQAADFYEEIGVKIEIGGQVYRLREEAGLSREELAEQAGTTASVVEDIEESDYEGDFLAMATRLASALRRRMEVRFVKSDSQPAPQP